MAPHGLLLAIILTLTMLLVPLNGHAASFDCARASSRVERLICSDADISTLDESLSAAYAAFLRTSSEPATVRRDQKDWLKQRDACQDVDCIRWLYESRLAELTINAAENQPGTWPRLTGGTHAQCAAALQVAKGAFKSPAVSLFPPPEISPDLGSLLVLKPQALDISGGDALDADPAVFDKLPIGGQGAPRSIYWQKAATYGRRLVVLATPFGWRGDTYSLFAIGETTPSDEFLAEVRQNPATQKFTAIIGDRWRPPLIFREKDSGRLWLIDVGEPYEFLAAWRIHGVEWSGIQYRCTVEFRPKVRRASSLLPPSVRELARLLDETMGPGENEGTLQPTAGLRLDVEHTWANAALRPWAMWTPYNTREEVDAGLKHWSQTGATYRKLYQSIQRQYSLAEQSLAEYYQKAFRRPAPDALALSSYVLDIALRSPYAFPSGDPNSYFRNSNSRPNPWRNE